MVTAVFLYLINNYLVYWQGMPGPYRLLLDLGWIAEVNAAPLSATAITQGWMQLTAYLLLLCLVAITALRSRYHSLTLDAARLEQLTAYLVRAAFWSVLLIGCVDMLISFLRIERLLQFWVGEELLTQLARPVFRGSYVHFPLIGVAMLIALTIKKISFSWLALLVVLAEFVIVLSRFVFSYEQAFMGDLVRFWYAALFLFASAYTLLSDGHVRVDVLYAGFTRVQKSWANILGSLLLGMPLCWVILMQGMGGKGNSINSPLLNFEISQSGYGMYVKYLMAGFLVLFALTMLIQFCSYVLFNIARLIEADELQPDPDSGSSIAGTEMHRTTTSGV
ncbi:MAG: TRAP transporter small permease subunit [Gammaproteobacteria bacterium]|nr:TRAP transporter small permease subunit [Gammaproteobacteria bacterium]